MVIKFGVSRRRLDLKKIECVGQYKWFKCRRGYFRCDVCTKNQNMSIIKSRHPYRIHKAFKIKPKNSHYIASSIQQATTLIHSIMKAPSQACSHSVITGLFSLALGLCSLGFCSSIFLRNRQNLLSYHIRENLLF